MAKAFAIHPELPWQKPVEELRVKATASINYQTKQPFLKKPQANCLLNSAMPTIFNNGKHVSHTSCPYV